MKENQNLKRNLIAEKFIFNSRSRKQDENRSNYMAELRRWFQYEDSLGEVWRFPRRSASWQITLWFKSQENAATITKHRCIANPAKSLRYRPVAGICNLTSGSCTKQDSEREWRWVV